ncbi:MAG TPA: hypothetical protein PL124_08795 [Candidatus Cloacimonadota bacterium]|nr:hypothetical protein [Candidatus Cloacimonadota bacterium]
MYIYRKIKYIYEEILMDETPRKWSTSEVLKVGGVIARQGVFTGHSPDLGTPDKPGFRENVFTPSVLEMITKNFKKPVPIYIDHSYDPKEKRRERGKSFKVGNSPMRDNVSHEGIVWDEEARKLIEEGGYGQISPEIDLTWDAQGNIVDASLTAVTYVRNPSIGGTGGQCMAMCFDKGPITPGDQSMAPGDQTPPSGGNQAPPENPPAVPNVPPAAPPQAPAIPQSPPVMPPQQPQAPVVQYVADPALVARVNELSAQLAKYNEVMPGLIQQNENMRTQQLGAISNELKAMGIESPETLVDGLPMEGKIKALAAFREQLIKTAPMVKPPENVSAIAARAEQDKNLFNQALASLGLTEADYQRVMAGGKING